jgi:hypothetical protein
MSYSAIMFVRSARLVSLTHVFFFILGIPWEIEEGDPSVLLVRMASSDVEYQACCLVGIVSSKIFSELQHAWYLTLYCGATSSMMDKHT